MMSLQELMQLPVSGSLALSVFAYLFSLVASVYYVFPYLSLRNRLRKKEVTIVVMGDLGHSPRMNYHALSFAKAEMLVNLCGYTESEVSEDVIDNEMIDIFPIEVIANPGKWPFVVFAAYKVVLQLYQLFALLILLQGSRYYMVQNPPSMPLLAVVIIFIRVFSPKSKLVIDWHNLNYTILNMKFNNLKHPLVKILRIYEKYLARFAAVNITVTDQMKEFLINEFRVDPKTIVSFHDRPGAQFRPLPSIGISRDNVLTNHEIFSDIEDVKNCKILVSATSFTPDEDFGILLLALKRYDENDSEKTPLFAVITGKGPLKQQFMDTIVSLKFLKKVIIRNAWLSTEDYPIILACADLAVSLHTSLSGIDLPMKIVDFFGVGVPVVTLRFPAIGELVKHGVNGLVVPGIKSSSDEMYDSISILLSDDQLLATLKEGAMKESGQRWDENWKGKLYPVLCD